MNEWIRRRNGGSGRVRLFCFAQAGGGASVFARWQRSAAPQLEICAVQLPGREDRIRESPPTDLAELLESLAVELSRYGDKPYAVYGHSLGARLAFELTRFLRAQKLPAPVHLFISGSAPPDTPLPGYLGHLSDSEFLANVLLWYQGIPQAVLKEPELVRAVLPALKADFRLLEAMRYTPEPPLDIAISAFGGRSDYAVPERSLAGWAAHTTGPFRLEMFGGDHFILRTSAEALLHSITRDLEVRFPPL
jgi:medium-chain acyl-[acyl-carrier-protein] hydrolase